MDKDLLYEIKDLLPEPVLFSLKKELTISEDMDEEVNTASAKFGFYAILAEKADARVEKMKISFSIWQAKVKSMRDKESDLAKEKRLSESRLQNYVENQPKNEAYLMKLHQLRTHRRVLKAIANAFKIKSELIQTKCANRRHEGG